MDTLNSRCAISQSKIVTGTNRTQLPNSPVNWLASQANRAIGYAYETLCSLPNITHMIVSAPSRSLVLLTLAGRCITSVSATPYSPTSASATTPTTLSLDPSVPSAPPYVPPAPNPQWMAAVDNGDPPPTNQDHQSVRQADSWPHLENRCVEKGMLPPYSEPRLSLVCPGSALPLDQSRNLRHESLQCAKAEYSWTRYPDLVDEAVWYALKETDPKEAVRQLRDHPAPRYEGILYYPIEHIWYWEACLPIKDPLVCGTDRECDTSTGQNPHHSSDTSNCRDVPRSCYADVLREGRQPCGLGKLFYNVEFTKKKTSDWRLGKPGFIPRLANGYDLLHGEEERLSISNAHSSSAQLTPKFSIDDPKNAYKIYLHANDNPWNFGSLQCRPNGEDHVVFEVIPEPKQRMTSRVSNSLSLPDGDMSAAIMWGGAFDLNGDYQSRGYVSGLIVEDTAGSTFQDLSLSTMSAEATPLIRVQLYEPTWSGGERLKSTAYFDDDIQLVNTDSDTFPGNGTSTTSGASARYQLNFDNGTGVAIYRTYLPGIVYYPGRLLFSPEMLSYKDYLAPDTRYTFRLTMNMKNLPFHFQSCTSEPSASDLQWHALWGLLSSDRYESRRFSSKSLDITVRTPSQVELRSWQSTFWGLVRYAQYAAPFFGFYKALMTGNRL